MSLVSLNLFPSTYIGSSMETSHLHTNMLKSDGEQAVHVGVTLGLTLIMVTSIQGNAEKIRASAQCVTPFSAKKINRSRSQTVENVERLLSVWISDQNQLNIPLSLALIQAKAQSLFVDLRAEGGEKSQQEEFSTSSGWFRNFCNKFNIHSVRTTGKAVSAYTTAAATFCDELQQIFDESGYSVKQVFNVVEIGLFWKSMPSLW